MIRSEVLQSARILYLAPQLLGKSSRRISASQGRAAVGQSSSNHMGEADCSYFRRSPQAISGSPYGADEPSKGVCLRLVKDSGRPLLTYAAPVHEHDPVCDPPSKAQLVSDDDHRSARLPQGVDEGQDI